MSSSLIIEEISGRHQLRRFVQFSMDLYRGVDAYVPPMISSELDSLDPEKNPAFEFCQTVYYIARRGQTWVGRIAGIINHVSNERNNRRDCRFCYCDFVDDLEVSRALFDAVAQWGRSQGMTQLVGPLGLTDIDYEGALIEGFDELATNVEIYNFPYYIDHYRAYGMTPEAYWNGYHLLTPTTVPEKHRRVAELVRQRYGLRALCIRNTKTLVNQYGQKIFKLYNESYSTLYGFTPISQRQIDYYIQLYLPQVRTDLIRLVVDQEDNLLAFGISIPSLSRAQKKARGRMFPLGWFYMAKTMYLTRTSLLGRLLKGGTDTVDLLLMGVRPDWQGKGINSLIFTELIEQFNRNGYTHVETNNELETNHKIQNLWSEFDCRKHKRRCTFKLSI